MSTRSAHAQPAAVAGSADAREMARARLVEGVDLLRLGQYAAALARFEQAYALVPSPNIHYDRGLAYVGLGRNAEALEAFEAFLAKADHPPPGTREKAEHHRETLRVRVAILEVTSDPAGAEVTVDGRRCGVTPIGHAVHVDPGPHEVAARNLATGAAASERIAALAGQKLTVTLHLHAAGARPRPVEGPRAPASTAVSVVTAPAAETATASETRAGDGPRSPAAWPATDVWALSAVGLGVALLGAGVTFGVLVEHEENRVAAAARNSMPSAGMTTQFDGPLRASESRGIRDQTLETVFLATGAAAVAAGILLYTIKPRIDHRAEHRASDANATLPSHAGPALSGGPILAPALAGARVQLSF